MIASIATAVFPVCLSPIINSLWPRPTGINVSIAFIPVCTGSWTDFLWIIPGAFTSKRLFSFDFISPLPSIGFPKPSTTLPNKDFPIGNSRIFFVLLTVSPSLIFLSSPKITAPTLSC